MTFYEIGKKLIRSADRTFGVFLNLVLLATLLLGAVFLWEVRQVNQAAEARNYTAYRPAMDDEARFDKLRAINPEVIAWLTVNDTPVDYPVTRTDNNEKYLNMDATGQLAMSGAVFMDYRNSADFSDFTSILYGHDMEKRLMFGSLSDFVEQEYMDSHPYGNLFYNGENHGVEFFALVLTNAYDRQLYSFGLESREERLSYISDIFDKAVTRRECSVGEDDHLLVLSTCTSEITNGRYLLIGKQTDELHLQEREEKPREIRQGSGTDDRIAGELNSVPIWLWIAALCVLIAGLVLLERRTGRKRRQQKNLDS